MQAMSRKVPQPDLKTVTSPPALLASQIKKLRIQRGWTQAEVARQVGVERTLIGNYEQGLNYPSVPTLQKLARLFGVTVDHLLNGEEKPVEGFQDRELLDFCLHADKLDHSSRFALKRVIEGLLSRESREHSIPNRKPAA